MQSARKAKFMSRAAKRAQSFISKIEFYSSFLSATVVYVEKTVPRHLMMIYVSTFSFVSNQLSLLYLLEAQLKAFNIIMNREIAGKFVFIS